MTRKIAYLSRFGLDKQRLDHETKRARHKAWKLHKQLCNITGASKDVHSTNFFNSHSLMKEKANTSTAKPFIKSKDRMYIVDCGASLLMLGESSLNAQDRSNIWKTTGYLDIHTANGVVRSTKEANVHIQELGACLFVGSVEDSLAVFSVGQLCDELGNSYSWQPEENPKITECERTITCCFDNFVPLVAVTKRKSCSALGYNSNPARPRKGEPCVRKEAEETELFSELMIDVDDDALVEKSFSWKRSKGKPSCENNTSFVCTRCGWRPVR